MTTPGKIGILGGMGPEATVLMMQRIMRATPATCDEEHIPMIVDNNTQVPSRIAALIDGTGADPAPMLANMAKGLARAGAEALIMPCNTAHAYVDAITGATDVPFLNMLEISSRIAVERIGTGRRIGILASPAVRQIRLFEKYFGKAGLEAHHPADADAALAAIRKIKSNGTGGEATRLVIEVTRQLCADGIDGLIIGCSELSLAAEPIRSIAGTLPCIDTIDVLADAAVRFAMEHSAR